MITIIHGDDIAASRDYLFELKKSLPGISFDKENFTYVNLLQILKGSTLFAETKNIFIENFLSTKKTVPNFKEIINLINKNDAKFNIVFWDNNELSKPTLSLFKDVKTKLFKIPQSLFSFLDNIKPNNTMSLVAFHELLKTSDTEMVFYMMLRQFRLLLALSDGSNAIDETKRLAPWQKNKLKRQAHFFSFEKLKSIYNKLFEIDLKTKTGEITNLTNSIDILLLDI